MPGSPPSTRPMSHNTRVIWSRCKDLLSLGPSASPALCVTRTRAQRGQHLAATSSRRRTLITQAPARNRAAKAALRAKPARQRGARHSRGTRGAGASSPLPAPAQAPWDGSRAGAEEGWTWLQEGKEEAATVEVLLCRAEQEAPDTISGSNPAPAAPTLKTLSHPFQGFRGVLPLGKCL